MRDEIKIELLKLSLERFLETSQRLNEGAGQSLQDNSLHDITGFPEDHREVPTMLLQKSFNQLKSALEERNDYIIRLKPFLVSLKDNLIALNRIKKFVIQIKESWGYRIGRGLVNSTSLFIAKSKRVNALDKIVQKADGIIHNYEYAALPIEEAPHYLHPAYWLSPRKFGQTSALTDRSIAIIILNLNGEKHLTRLFDSFLNYNTYKNFRFIIVDHSSDDNSIEVIKAYQTKLPVELLRFDQNLTFSYSNNYAVERTAAGYLLFLNNDIVFTGDVLGKFVDTIEQSDEVGIVGATLYFPGESPDIPGNVQHSGILFRPEMLTLHDEPGDNTGQNGGSDTGWKQKEQLILRPVNSTSVIVPETVEFSAVTGAALFIRKNDFIALNGFDENFIWGYEDVSLCIGCIEKLKKKVVVSNAIRMIHNEGSTRKYHQVFNRYVRSHNLAVLQKNHGVFLRNALIHVTKRMANDEKVSYPGEAGTSHLLNFLLESNDTAIKVNYKKRINKPDRIRIAIKNPVAIGENSEYWGDTFFARSLSKALEELGYSVRIDFLNEWYNNGYLEDEVVLVIRGLQRYFPNPGQLNLMWNISHPKLVSDEEYEGFDHVFIASSIYQKKLEKRLKVPVSVLLQCTDPEIFFPDPDPDIPFNSILNVSNFRLTRRKSVEYCLKNKIPLSIYGRNWQGKAPGKLIAGGFIPNHVLRKYYSRCHVLLNEHWEDMAENGFMTNRLFDAIACACPVLSDYCDGVESVFGDSIHFHSSEEEFLNQLEKLTNDPLKHKKNAALWGQKIRKQHSFHNRAEEISRYVDSFISLGGKT